MEHEYPQRARWHAFPDVVICARESDVKNHPDYEQAKEGNLQDSAPAAKRLSSAMVTSEAIAMLRLFDGAVDQELPYVLVDDFIGQGGLRLLVSHRKRSAISRSCRECRHHQIAHF